jgi:hypothetical protein
VVPPQLGAGEQKDLRGGRIPGRVLALPVDDGHRGGRRQPAMTAGESGLRSALSNSSSMSFTASAAVME